MLTESDIKDCFLSVIKDTSNVWDCNTEKEYIATVAYMNGAEDLMTVILRKMEEKRRND